MKAVGKYIVINPIEEKQKETESGLILTEKNREDIRYRKAVVEVVGDEVKGINENDVVYYDRHAGFTLELESNIKTIIKEYDIVVVV
tara:strand:+ start:122 stop:382 length:261 start_codon:yes stop_codon:yes gene_type:complete